jgi:hypothetical protein
VTEVVGVFCAFSCARFNRAAPAVWLLRGRPAASSNLRASVSPPAKVTLLTSADSHALLPLNHHFEEVLRNKTASLPAACGIIYGGI